MPATWLTGPIQAKQLNKPMIAPVQISGLSFPAAATMDVSTALAATVSTAGAGVSPFAASTSVPHQTASGTQMGWVLTPPDNRVEVYTTAAGNKIASSANNEVYGRLTAAGAVYTLSLYELIAGIETAYAMPAITSIRGEFDYLYTFDALPYNAITALNARNVAQDATTGIRLYQEIVTVTALNTLAALTKSYTASGVFQMNINGQTVLPIGGASAGFSVAGTAVTLSAANLGFNVSTTDVVSCTYQY